MGRKGVIGRGMRVVLLGTLGLAACATMAPEPTLYERFGPVDGVGIPRKGPDAISVVVDRFVANMVADARRNARVKRMAPPAVQNLKSKLSHQTCQAARGHPPHYPRYTACPHPG